MSTTKISKIEGSSSDYKLLTIGVTFNHPVAENIDLDLMQISLITKVEGSENTEELVKDTNFKIKSAEMSQSRRKLKIQVELVDKPLSEAVFTILNARKIFISKEMTLPSDKYDQISSFPGQERRPGKLYME